MPRGQPREATSRGINGETSSSTAASVRSRRALGDVSNKESKENNNDANAKKKSESQATTLRRSRRLSNEPSTARDEESNPVEDIAETTTSRSQSFRSTATASAKVKVKPAVNPFAEPAPRGPVSRKRVAKAQGTSEEDLNSKKPARETKPRAKRLRGSKPVVSEVSDDSEDLSQHVPISTGNNPCQDILINADHRLNRQPFSDREYTQGVGIYDAEIKDDVLQVPTYVTDIFQRLFNAEETTRPHPYMDGQPELNGMMRSILVDWLIEVHMKFRLLPETLYLCVNIIDRYLSHKTVQRNRLQLVGVTALLIACKYEEIYPPEVKDCVYITDRAYTRQDVLDMEAEVVKTLKFSLTVPTGYPFLQRFLHVTNASSIVRNLANYYMERMLQEHSALKFKPSLLAASAVCLANSNPDRFEREGFTEEDDLPSKFPPALLDYSGFHENEIREAAALMEAKVGDLGATARSRDLVAVRRKYESNRYENVADIGCFTNPKASHLDTP